MRRLRQCCTLCTDAYLHTSQTAPVQLYGLSTSATALNSANLAKRPRDGEAFIDESARAANRMNQATVRTTNPLLKRYQQLFLSGRDGNVFEGSLTGSGGFVRDVHKKVSITRASATAVSSRTTKRWKATTPQTLEGALKQTDQARVIMELSSPHRITHVSNAWEELCGYELSEVAGQPAFSILGGRLTDERKTDAIREVVEACGYADFDMLHYHKDGTPFTNTVHVSALLGDHGRPTHLLAALHSLSLDDVDFAPHLDGVKPMNGNPDTAH